MIFISCDSDGKKINGDILLTILDNERTSTQIYRMTEDGELTKLTPFDDAESYNGRWSPDGKKIVFQTGKGAYSGTASLYIMDSDGSNPRPVKEIKLGSGHTIPLFGSNPAWSPDGKKIVYDDCDCEAGGNSDVFIVNLETKQVINLTNNPAFDATPIWSPDGSKIIFLSNRNNVSGLYMMNANGSNAIKIADGAVHAWSAVDSLISFFSDSSVHIMNVSTMTEKDSIPILISGEVVAPPMTWSPDNSSILFITVSTDGYDRHHLYRLDLQDHSISRLLETYDYVMHVDWLKR